MAATSSWIPQARSWSPWSPQPLDTPHYLQLHQLMREQLLGKWREEEEGEEFIDLKYL